MALAERAGLSELVADKVKITGEPVPSTGANPAGKVTSIVAGMAAGAAGGRGTSLRDVDTCLRYGTLARRIYPMHAARITGGGEPRWGRFSAAATPARRRAASGTVLRCPPTVTAR